MMNARQSFSLRSFAPFLYGLLFLLALGVSELTKAATAVTPVKPAIDQTRQAVLTLPNGLHVLVIEDPNATQSIVALNVAAGGYRDPVNFIGLSHFLEHATFMGSRKFPDASGLFNYIAAYGGLINANTTDTGTTYFFRLEIDALPEALERLTDAIAYPNLAEKNALGELNNVEAEYIANLHQFPRQYSDAMAQAIYNPKHPIAHQPRGGNLKSLKDAPNEKLITALRAFHRHYYSANLMNAVVYSRMPLSTLSQIATQYLGQIPNRGTRLTPITEKRIIHKEKILHLRAEDQGKMIVLTFEVPKLKNNFAAFSYVDFLLKNMSPGTAYGLLYQNNLVSALSTSYEVTYQEPEDEFNIYLELTEKGVGKQDVIVNTIFNYLDLIREKGVNDAYFKQLQQTLASNFSHLKMDYSLNRIALLSTLMQELPPQNLYNYYLIPKSMRPGEVAATLKYLTPNNANIAYSSEQEPYQKISSSYHAKYSTENFAPERFSNHKVRQNFAKELKLPPLNRYVASDFTINNPKSLKRVTPKLLDNPYGILLYSMPSRFFKDNPNAYLNIAITSPVTPKRPQDYVLPALTDIMFFKKYLGEFSQYDLANISWDYEFNRGQNLFLVGIPEHMLSLTQDFLSRFKNFKFDNPEMLELAKIQLQRNIVEKRGTMGALDYAFELTDAFIPDFIADETVLPAISKVTLADLNRYQEKITGRHKTKILSLGNLNDAQVLQFARAVEAIFPSNEKAYPEHRVPQLTTQKMVYRKKIKNENNAMIQIYYLPRYHYLENIIYARFISYILNDVYFDELRTKEQLGYTVGVAEVRINPEQKALAYFVESPKSSPKELYYATRAFNEKAIEYLANMTEEQFNQFKHNIDINLSGIAQDMKDEFSEHNADFLIENTGKPIYGRLSKITRKITQKEVIRYFQEAVLEEKGVVLLGEIVGNKKDLLRDTIVPPGFTVYPSLQKLHEALKFAPLPPLN